VRTLFTQAAVAGFCGFAVSGLFGPLTPTFMLADLGIASHAAAGAVVCSLVVASVAGQLAVNRMRRETALLSGCTVLMAGVGLLAAAVALDSLALFVLAMVAGSGQGLNIGAGLAAVNARVDAAVRGEVASTYFVLIYLGLIIPVVGVGLLSDVLGLRSAAYVFSAVIGLLILSVLATLGRDLLRVAGIPLRSSAS
jgi:hypothetical protein